MRAEHRDRLRFAVRGRYVMTCWDSAGGLRWLYDCDKGPGVVVVVGYDDNGRERWH